MTSTSHGAPVELHAASDPVDARAKDQSAVLVKGHIMSGSVVGRVQIVRVSRILGRECVDALDERSDVERFPMSANFGLSCFGRQKVCDLNV